MKLAVWVFLGVATGTSLACAEPFKVLELGLTINGVVLASESFPPQEYAKALRHGADYACRQPEGAIQHYSNMLQARCVAADMNSGMDRSDVLRDCFGSARRSSFVALAELTCTTLNSGPGFLLAHEGHPPSDATGVTPTSGERHE